MDYSGDGMEPQNIPPEPVAPQSLFAANTIATPQAAPQQFGMPAPTYSPNVPLQPMVTPITPQPSLQSPSQWQPTMTQPPQNFAPTASAVPLVVPIDPATQPVQVAGPAPAAVPTPSKPAGVPIFVWIIFIVLVLGAGGLATAVVFMK